MYSFATAIVGLNFSARGATVSPALPATLGAFAFRSALANVSRDDAGAYRGMLRPLLDSHSCEVILELPRQGEEGAAADTGRLTGRARLRRAGAAAMVGASSWHAAVEGELGDDAAGA